MTTAMLPSQKEGAPSAPHTEAMELQQLVETLEAKGLQALSSAELLRIPTLLQSITNQAAIARSTGVHEAQLAALEALQARAWVQLSRQRRGRLREALRLFAQDIPRQLFAAWPMIALAGAFILAGIATGRSIEPNIHQLAEHLPLSLILPIHGITNPDMAAQMLAFAEQGGPILIATPYLGVLKFFGVLSCMAFVSIFFASIPTPLFLFAGGSVLGVILTAIPVEFQASFLALLSPIFVPAFLSISFAWASGGRFAQAILSLRKSHRRRVIAELGQSALFLSVASFSFALFGALAIAMHVFTEGTPNMALPLALIANTPLLLYIFLWGGIQHGLYLRHLAKEPQ